MQEARFSAQRNTNKQENSILPIKREAIKIGCYYRPQKGSDRDDGLYCIIQNPVPRTAITLVGIRQ